jgi:hypothetical protein
VARTTGTNREAVWLRVAIYGADGEELQVSKAFKWQDAYGDFPTHFGEPPELYFGPAGNKLLVYCCGRCGLYDVANDRITMLDGYNPVAIGGAVVRPDGKGFLVTGFEKVYWYSWEGKAKEIPMKELPYQLLENARVCGSAWEKDIAVVRWSTTRIRIDTNKLEATADEVKPELTGDNKVVQMKYQFAGNGPTVRVVELRKLGENGKAADDKEEVRDEPGFSVFRVELLSEGAKMSTVLLECVKGHVQLLPSPDGKYLAVDCLSHPDIENPKKEGEVRRSFRTILVVNQKGEVAGKIEPPK